MSSDPEWKYVNVRRLFNYLEHSIDRATQWAVFEPNDETLWSQLRLAITSFLTSLYRQGAFAGATAAEAFFAAPAWPYSPAVRCEIWTELTQTGPVLVHHRETCCLIHLAPDHAKCSPCSKLSREERTERWSESILASLRAVL